MKFILKNIEKIIFGIFLILFIAIIVIARTGFIKEVKPITFPQMPKEFNLPEADRLQFERYDELIRKIRKLEALSSHASLAERNFFYKYEKPKPPEPLFIVREIQLLPLDLIYQGVIELLGSRLVAQINFEGKTYFLKEGSIFADYEVKEITKDFCLVLDAEGQKMQLPYKRKVFSKEYEARLYDPKTKNSLKVKKGFKIKEYEVLDIGVDYVVLLDKNEDRIVLKKGEE